jgi:predicted dienelactone hydrolase
MFRPTAAGTISSNRFHGEVLVTTRMTRRRLLGTTLAVGAGLPLAGLGTAAQAASAPVQLRLPRPTGPHPVGTVQLPVVDRSRNRELMTSIWYPAHDVARHPRAPWMPPAVLRAYLTSAGFAADAALTPPTAGHLRAPVRPGGRLPVVVFSHGAHDHRSDTTIVVQELASHGYAVVTVDHTGDAFTQLPDGQILEPVDNPSLVPSDFAADLRSVLDHVLNNTPHPLRLDPHRVGAFGWSKGATATALAMIGDRRIRVGLSLDGPMQCDPPITTDLDRPFMLMTADFTRAAEPSVADFWHHLRGWRLNIQAAGAIHSSYCDLQLLFPQLAAALGMSDEELETWIGTLAPSRALRIQQAYPLAFFDQHLRGRRSHLLDGPSPAFPEVTFIR